MKELQQQQLALQQQQQSELLKRHLPQQQPQQLQQVTSQLLRRIRLKQLLMLDLISLTQGIVPIHDFYCEFRDKIF